jgi:hypothetical protein
MKTPRRHGNFPSSTTKLDAAGIRKAAKTYLSNENRIQVTLMPEKK